MKRAFLRWGGIVALVSLAALLLAFRVPHGLTSLQERHGQIRQLQNENAELARQNAEKRARLEELRKSRAARELEVRKRLKLQKEGETTFIPQDDKAGK